MSHALFLRCTGFILSLLFTLASYLIIVDPEFFHLDIQQSIITIFIFALLQAFVQLIFFINVWGEEGPLWNLGVFLSTLCIIFIVIYFSIWIMNHLNYNMR